MENFNYNDLIACFIIFGATALIMSFFIGLSESNYRLRVKVWHLFLPTYFLGFFAAKVGSLEIYKGK